MPIIVIIGNEKHWITPSTEWQTLKTKSSKLPVKVKRDFYMKSKEIL